MPESTVLELTTGDIAELVGGELRGPGTIPITGIATLQNAAPSDLSFLGNAKYTNQVTQSRAGAVLVPLEFCLTPPTSRAWIECKDPSAAFLLVTDRFVPAPAIPAAGIHPSAVVADSASLAAGIHVGANAVIDDGVSIGANTIIEAGTYIGRDSQVGQQCRFQPNVTIRERSKIGDRVIIHSGTVIGSDGFGYIMGPDGHQKIPQVGIVQIDDDVEIGANVTIDRARFDKTWIKRGTKIDNLVQIAHNVEIGENVIVVAQVGISGSTEIGDRAILAGQSGVAGHLRIGAGAVVMARAAVLADVEPGAQVIGFPAIPRKEFWRQSALIQKLPEIRKSIKQLEKEIAALRSDIANDNT